MNHRKKLARDRNFIINKIKRLREKKYIDEKTRMNTYADFKRIQYFIEQQILDTFKTDKDKKLYLSRIKR